MVLETLGGLELIIFVTIIFILLLSGAIIMFVFLSRWRWPFKVILLENLSGQGFVPTSRDRARMISFGDGGEEIFLLKKKKKYRVAYGKRIGKNYIAWAVGRDGYWYNITFGDLDKKLVEIGVVPVDRDMRFATASLRKGIEKRYDDKTFFEKWAVPITIGMLIIAALVNAGAIWFILNQMRETTAATAEAVKVSKEVMELAKNVLGAVDNIKGGSGLVPA